MIFLGGCTIQNDTFVVNTPSYEVTIGDSFNLDIFVIGNAPLTIMNENPEIVTIEGLSVNAIAEGDAILIVGLEGISETFAIDITVHPLPIYVITGEQTIDVGEQSPYQLLIDDELALEVIWQVSDDTLATITSDGLLIALAAGKVEIEAMMDSDIVASTTVTILPIILPAFEFQTNTTALVCETRVLSIENHEPVTWDSSNTSVATINNSGEIHFVGVGAVTIRATSTAYPMQFVEQTIEVSDIINTSLLKIIVDPSIDQHPEQSIFYIGGVDYHRNVNIFPTIAQAIEEAILHTEIVLLGGTYNEDITIAKSSIKIVGPNKDKNPITQERDEEAILEGKIRIQDQVKELTLNGLCFTKGGTVTAEGQANTFTFINNVVKDTSVVATSWADGATYGTGFLLFVGGTKYSNNVIIENNHFSNLGDMGILLSNMDSFKIINNTFDGFSKDAIRMSNGIVNKSCQWVIMGNTFKNGEYNGIFFRTYGSKSPNIENIISIFDNTFIEVGKKTVQFSGAVSFRNYQEGLTTINMSYNHFEDCANYILLRNNAAVANQVRFKAFINYNTFIGLPSTYYLKNKNSTDTEASNPSNINMNHNFYGTDTTHPIALASHSSKFMGASSNEPLSSYDALLASPKVYGSNLVHLDSNPKMLSDENAIFSSSNQSIFTVNQEGIITPLKEGTAILTISKGTYTTTFPIIVGKSINIDYIHLLLQKALSEEGYREGTNNDTKFGTWYGLPNQAWCAMFVSWCSNQVGISTDIIPKYASVSIGMDWFKTRGLFQYKENYVPKAGDLIFFKSDGASHTGIVISCDGTTVYTIEGNTSDMVAKRSYTLLYSKITGYGLPEYPSYEGESFTFDISGATDGEGHSTR